MKDTQLYARLVGLGMPKRKAEEIAAKIRDDIHPRAAVASLRLMKIARVEPGLSGTGMQAASMASTGAKVGSTFGPIGTGIGLVIGAIAGALIHKGTAPQRTAEALKMIQDIRALPVDFTGRLLQWDDYRKMIYAVILARDFAPGFTNWHGWEGGRLTAHPSSMTNLYLTTMEVARTVMTAANGAQPGAQLAVTLYMGPNKSYPASGQYVFVNPGITGSPSVDYTNIVRPALIWMESQRDPKYVQQSVDHPDAEHVMMLATDKLLSELRPATMSTVIANAPVALVPRDLALRGADLAQSYINAGQLPSVSLPAVQTYQATMLPRQDPGSVAPTFYPPAAMDDMSMLPSQLVPSPTQDATAGIMRDVIARDTGAYMNSPAARQVLADVAADGVEKTSAGPKAPTPGWVLPTGALAALALLR